MITIKRRESQKNKKPLRLTTKERRGIAEVIKYQLSLGKTIAEIRSEIQGIDHDEFNQIVGEFHVMDFKWE